jgi:hypothetical protein
MARRGNGAPRWRCKACRKDFSITSGTLFAFHKMPLRSYLMAIAIFANEVKGKSMLALSRDLGTQYKTAFVLAHKMREAMAAEVRQMPVGGEGKKAEIDGAFFGGHVRSANRRENRRDRRLRENQSGKRKVVVVIRERGGNTLPSVFRSEVEALNFIRRQVPQGTTLYADEAGPWNELYRVGFIYALRHLAASEPFLALRITAHSPNIIRVGFRVEQPQSGINMDQRCSEPVNFTAVHFDLARDLGSHPAERTDRNWLFIGQGEVRHAAIVQHAETG